MWEQNNSLESHDSNQDEVNETIFDKGNIIAKKIKIKWEFHKTEGYQLEINDFISIEYNNIYDEIHRKNNNYIEKTIKDPYTFSHNIKERLCLDVSIPILKKQTMARHTWDEDNSNTDEILIRLNDINTLIDEKKSTEIVEDKKNEATDTLSADPSSQV